MHWNLEHFFVSPSTPIFYAQRRNRLNLLALAGEYIDEKSAWLACRLGLSVWRRSNPQLPPADWATDVFQRLRHRLKSARELVPGNLVGASVLSVANDEMHIVAVGENRVIVYNDNAVIYETRDHVLGWDWPMGLTNDENFSHAAVPTRKLGPTDGGKPEQRYHWHLPPTCRIAIASRELHSNRSICSIEEIPAILPSVVETMLPEIDIRLTPLQRSWRPHGGPLPTWLTDPENDEHLQTIKHRQQQFQLAIFGSGLP